MPYRIFLSIITVKTLFLSSPLISLYCKSVKGVSCTKTNIFTGGDWLIDIPIKVKWFSITGFLVIGYFQGRPQLRFIAVLVGLVNLQGTFKVGKSTSNLFSLISIFSLSNLTDASSSFNLTNTSSSFNLTNTSSSFNLILQVYSG